MPAVLTKTESVLDFIGIDEYDLARFAHRPDEGDEFQGRYVALDPAAYADLGEPEVITMTIEPGDRLNNEAAA